MQRPSTVPLKARIEELKALRDEIRLDLHLASMDLRDEWKHLEKELPGPEIVTELKVATTEAVDRLTGELRRFLSRLRNSSGVRTAVQLMRVAVTGRPDDSLATAVTSMWDHDIGFLPITDEQRRLLGVLTDRDACIAASTRGKRMDELLVWTVMTTEVASCREGDAIEDVLALMRSRQVRRVPVINETHEIVGVVTINDIARAVTSAPQGVRGVDAGAIAHALTEITGSSTDATTPN